jgi:hypothetical protein
LLASNFASQQLRPSINWRHARITPGYDRPLSVLSDTC